MLSALLLHHPRLKAKVWRQLVCSLKLRHRASKQRHCCSSLQEPLSMRQTSIQMTSTSRSNHSCSLPLPLLFRYTTENFFRHLIPLTLSSNQHSKIIQKPSFLKQSTLLTHPILNLAVLLKLNRPRMHKLLLLKSRVHHLSLLCRSPKHINSPVRLQLP